MRSFFQPATGPSWLGQVLSSIRAALGDIWPAPLRLKDYATADLPTAADFTGGAVWDSTLLTFRISDGANWLQFAAYGSGVLSFNTRVGAVTLTSGDVTTALGFTPVTNARTVSTTAPLAGGGALSGNLTLSITAATGAAAGSMSAADKAKLDAISGTNTGDQTITLTGNVTGSGTGSFATTIAAGAVTLAMQASMATASVVYRKTAGSGAPEVQTLATLKTDLGLTGTNSGDQTITLTGDATGSGTGSFAVTVGKVNGVSFAGLATGILKNTTGTGAPSIAVAGDFPTLNQNTTGSAATLTTARNIDGQAFDGSAAITVIAPGTHAASSKTTPVDADELPLVDSAASNVLKKLTWANLKATLKTYFDTLYSSLTNFSADGSGNIVIRSTVGGSTYLDSYDGGLTLRNVSNGYATVFSAHPTNGFRVTAGLPGSYANDAAAATGGVAVSQFYRNGSVVMIRVT